MALLSVFRASDFDWLGTSEGLFRVERSTGRRQPVGGLPRGAVVAITPEAALVESGSRLTACLAEPGGRWRVVGELASTANTAPWGWQATLARGWIAVSASHVAFVPRQVPQSSAPFALLVRHTGQALPLEWDPALRADHGSVLVTGLQLDSDRLRLGTNLGVLQVRPGRPWERLVPKLSVEALQGEVLITRARGERRLGGNSIQRGPSATWQLGQLRANGTVRSLAPAPAPSSPRNPWGERGPSAVVRTQDGARWCTVAGTEGLEQRIYKGQMLVASRFHRWDGKGWQSFGADQLEKVPDEAVMALVSGPYAPMWEQPNPLLAKRFPRWFS